MGYHAYNNLYLPEWEGEGFIVFVLCQTSNLNINNTKEEVSYLAWLVAAWIVSIVAWRAARLDYYYHYG